jgi:hypothetical protein
MSVYKHKRSPCWQFDFQIDSYRFFGSTEVPTDRPKREAEAVETAERRKAEQLVEKTTASKTGPMTLEAACDRWWNSVGQHLEESDLEKYLDWLKGKLGGKYLHDITNDDISTLVTERRAHLTKAGRTEKGVQLHRPITHRTVNQTVTLLLKRIMRRAHGEWDATILKWPNWKKHILKEPKRLTPEITIRQEQAIEAVERPDYRAVRELAFITGLRLAEVLLQWPQVDFENKVIRPPCSPKAASHARSRHRAEPTKFSGGNVGATRVGFHLHREEDTALSQNRPRLCSRRALPDHLLRPDDAAAPGVAEGRRQPRLSRHPPHCRPAHAAGDQEPQGCPDASRTFRHRDHV